MPPRITRLKWPRLVPPHESLPFRYPRWYSVDNATAEAATTSTPKDSSTHDEQNTPAQKELENTSQKFSSLSTTGLEDGAINVRRVPQSLVRKVQAKKLQETKRKELRAKSFHANDWRTPLMLLRKHTPEGKYHHVKQLARLEMPQGMRGFYPDNLFDLFLDIYLHTGCHVQVSRGDNHGQNKFHALEMSGTAATISMARHILNEAVQVESDENLNDRGTMGSYNTKTTPVVQDKVMPRSVWSMPHTAVKHLSNVREPNHWSFQSFAAYVAELVIATPSPALSQPIRPGISERNKPHVDLVTDRLMKLYTNPQSVRWASMHATVQTLQYLIQHRKIPQVRRILELVESQSKTAPYLRLVLANPSVFNVMLKSASQALDLHTYNFLLRMMTDRNVLPDVETWTSLLQLVQKVSPRDAKHIITTMRQRQMLSSPMAKLGIANATSQKDVMEWLGRGESIFDFVAHYDKLWKGKEWLDTRACNQILSVLIETGNLQDVMPLVKKLENRNKKPNLVTTHILVDASSAYRDLRFAINAMETTLGDPGNLQPDSRTFEKLAHLAFRVRAYNTLRVVWRYACLSGNVSGDLLRKMQKTLVSSLHVRGHTVKDKIEKTWNVVVDLDNEILENQISRQQRFKMFAAIVAVNITGDIESGTTLASPSTTTTTRDLEDPLKLVDTGSSSIDLNGTTPSNLHPTLAADLAAYASYRPVSTLLSALRRAIEQDLEWKQGGYDKSATLEVLLAQAMTVKVKKIALVLDEKLEQGKQVKEQKETRQKGMAKHKRNLRRQRRKRVLLALNKALEVQKTRAEAAKQRILARKKSLEEKRREVVKLEWQKKHQQMVKEAESAAGARAGVSAEAESVAGASAEARAAATAKKEETRKRIRREQQKVKAVHSILAKQKSWQYRALWAKKMLEMKTRRLKIRAKEARKETARAKQQARKEQGAREEKSREQREEEQEEKTRQEKEADEEWKKLHREMQELVKKK